MIKLRASSLNLLRHCAGWTTVAERARTDTQYTIRGTQFHEVSAYLLRGDPIPTSIPRQLVDEVRDYLKWWFELGLMARHPEPVIERYQEMEIAPDVTLTGHLDYLAADRDATIWDHKTGAGFGLPRDVADDLQMLAYCVLAKHAFPYIDNVTIFRVKTDRREYDPLHLDSAQLSACLHYVRDMCVDISRRHPTRTTGHHCSGCLAKNACTDYLDQSKALIKRPWDGGPLVSAEQVGRGLMAVGAGRAVLKKFEDKAREWILANGERLEYEGKVYSRSSYLKTNNVSIKPDDLRSLLFDSGAGDAVVSAVFGELEKRGKLKTATVRTWRWRG